MIHSKKSELPTRTHKAVPVLSKPQESKIIVSHHITNQDKSRPKTKNIGKVKKTPNKIKQLSIGTAESGMTFILNATGDVNFIKIGNHSKLRNPYFLFVASVLFTF